MTPYRTHRYPKAAVAALFLFLSVLAARPSLAQVHIDLYAQDFQKFPIAVTDFNRLSAGREADLSTWFGDTLTTYLNMTGFFNVIPKKAFLEVPTVPTQGFERINFPNWTMIGADYLVRGTHRVNNGVLSSEMRLYDTVKGELVASNRYSGKPEEKNTMVRRIASDILAAVTGDGSVFNTKLAFVRRAGRNTEISTINFDGTGLTQVTNMKSLIVMPRWSPDGARISFTSYRDGNPDLYIRDLKSGATKKASHRTGINLCSSWSPDGKKVLLTLSFEGNQEIYTMDVASGQLKRLTYSRDINISPAWSPDGRSIAFVSSRGGAPQVYIMDADGSNIRRLTYEGGYNSKPSWSSKNRIAYEGRAGGFQIFTIAPDGTGVTQITSTGGEHTYPSWSPDGRYIAFVVTSGGTQKIGVMNANGTNIRILTDGAYPAWSPVIE